MNVASRMESTSGRNRIHLSQATADLLIAADKEDWIVPREEAVVVKGKGELKTFWLKTDESDDIASSFSGSLQSNHSRYGAASVSGSVTEDDASSWADSDCEENNPSASTRIKLSKNDRRLVEWNANVLRERLQKLVEQREQKGGDEHANLPADLPTCVQMQILDFVTEIASRYKNNHFHNFQHCSHVTMSVTKLLARVAQYEDKESNHIFSNSFVRDISSDALTKFASVFVSMKYHRPLHTHCVFERATHKLCTIESFGTGGHRS